MITVSDSMNTIDCNSYFVILPSTPVLTKEMYDNHNNVITKLCDEGFNYNSFDNEHYLKVSEIVKLVKDNIKV